jgi:hypothetical protein
MPPPQHCQVHDHADQAADDQDYPGAARDEQQHNTYDEDQDAVGKVELRAHVGRS